MRSAIWYASCCCPQRYDTVGVALLIEEIHFDNLIADKAFDSNWIIADLNERGAGIVISQRPQRTKPLAIEAEVDQWRQLIEKFFCKLKEFKRIAMRSDKTDTSFAAMIQLAAAVINSRGISTGPRASGRKCAVVFGRIRCLEKKIERHNRFPIQVRLSSIS